MEWLVVGCLIWGYKSLPVSIPSSLTHKIETDFLQIYTDLDYKQANFYANVFDEFYRYFGQEYFQIHQEKKLQMLLFGTSNAYSRTTWNKSSPYGLYLGPKKNTIIVNLESGFGTATHELVHHFMAVGKINRYRSWVNEGIPTFFEKFMGYLDAEDKLHISFGYFSNWRFPQTKMIIDDFTLEKLFKTKNQSVARSFILFLHKKKNLTKFIQALYAKRGTADPAKTLQIIYGAGLATIESEWKDWVKSQPIDANVKLVQSAFVKSYPEWVRWQGANQRYLRWDKEQCLYVVKNNQSGDTIIRRGK
jgi:hypothetical protein